MDSFFSTGAWFVVSDDCGFGVTGDDVPIRLSSSTLSVVAVSGSNPASLKELMFTTAATDVTSLICVLLVSSDKSMSDLKFPCDLGQVSSFELDACGCCLHAIAGSGAFTGGAFRTGSDSRLLFGDAASVDTGPAACGSGVTDNC